MEAYMEPWDVAIGAVQDITGVADPACSGLGAGPVLVSLAGYYAAASSGKSAVSR